MKKLYLLLDNELKMCIAVDRCVVLYKEYDYTESILDQLYSKISAHNVDAAIVVTKGILSEQFFGESYKVFNFSIKDSKHSCYVSKFDVNKIVNLLNTAGVDDVRVLDKFGYYVSLNKHDCCMIDTLGNAYSVITFKDKIRDISYNSYQNLEKILINCNKKFAVDDFVDMTMYYDERYLKYFKNVDKIQEKLEKAVEDGDANTIKDLVMVLATLSTFAYTELKIAHYFELSPDKLTLVNANPIRSEDDYENDEYKDEYEDEYEDGYSDVNTSNDSQSALAQETSPEESKRTSQGALTQEDLKEAKKREKKSKKEKKEKKPAGKALKVANVLGIVLSVGMLSATVYSSRAVTSYTQQIGTLSTQNEEILDQIDTANTTLSDYQGFTNNLSTANTYAEMYSTLAKSSYGNDIKTVYYEDGVMKAEVYVKDTTKAAAKAKDDNKGKDKKKKENKVDSKVDSKDTITKRIKKDLAKSFEVQQLTEEKSDRDGYLLYAVNLAKK